MSEHLPECLHSRPCERAVRGTGDRHVVSGSRCDNCDDPCICDRLRACTVRVLGEAREAVWGLHTSSTAICDPKDPYCDAFDKATSAIDRLAQEAP